MQKCSRDQFFGPLHPINLSLWRVNPLKRLGHREHFKLEKWKSVSFRSTHTDCSPAFRFLGEYESLKGFFWSNFPREEIYKLNGQNVSENDT